MSPQSLRKIHRRLFLQTTALAATTSLAIATPATATKQPQPRPRRRKNVPQVAGRTTDPRIDFFNFPNGNAVDSAVATALIAAVKAPGQTGIGGYGLAALVASPNDNHILAVDGNSASPQAMPADVFKPDPNGTVRDRINDTGWLAAGVPGVLAGLQVLIDRFCSAPFAELVQPAILLAQQGYPWPEALSKTTGSRPIFRMDPGSKLLYLPGGNPISPGQIFRNPDLAALLQHLAAKNRVDDFYKGPIAKKIADAFATNGGLVTATDLANYSANVVTPLALTLGEFTVHTPPLTAGGLSVLQMLHAEYFLPPDLPHIPDIQLHAAVEIMRIAWKDRLTLLGDPTFSEIPTSRLLSTEYARESAAAAAAAAKNRHVIQHQIKANPQSGTIHISAADDSGLMIALTLTHGGSFGSGVTVPGLGLTLGHGMSRFDPRPGHPNGPGPNKRPLHNMVPAIVTRNGTPQFAIGGAGGRRIPNTVYSILRSYILNNQPLTNALHSTRFHSEGNNSIQFTADSPQQSIKYLNQLGYQTTTASPAAIAAVPRRN
jgi:gamma-glutamyltranspeptidase/glutathione hydrolase